LNIKEWLGEDNQIGIDIWEHKYRYQNETHDEWLDRVSGGNEKLRALIKETGFLFGGRALSNRGTTKKGSMFNCYSSGYAPDDIEGLMQLNSNLALTYKAQGGQGLSLSKIRPKGTPIGKEFKSDGIVPFMEIFNATTASISQGGARKGALMMSLDIRHKEAETFITIKTNEDKITKANLSLEIDDEFMTAVDKYYETGEEIVLHEHRWYNNHLVEYDVIPIKLYKLMMETVHKWAEPGCIFTNKFRNYNLMEFDDDYQIETCNPLTD
jgi:ribonucleoside-diphosphate reductase alpha chain